MSQTLRPSLQRYLVSAFRPSPGQPVSRRFLHDSAKNLGHNGQILSFGLLGIGSLKFQKNQKTYAP